MQLESSRLKGSVLAGLFVLLDSGEFSLVKCGSFEVGRVYHVITLLLFFHILLTTLLKPLDTG